MRIAYLLDIIKKIFFIFIVLISVLITGCKTSSNSGGEEPIPSLSISLGDIIALPIETLVDESAYYEAKISTNGSSKSSEEIEIDDITYPQSNKNITITPENTGEVGPGKLCINSAGHKARLKANETCFIDFNIRSSTSNTFVGKLQATVKSIDLYHTTEKKYAEHTVSTTFVPELTNQNKPIFLKSSGGKYFTGVIAPGHTLNIPVQAPKEGEGFNNLELHFPPWVTKNIDSCDSEPLVDGKVHYLKPGEVHIFACTFDNFTDFTPAQIDMLYKNEDSNHKPLIYTTAANSESTGISVINPDTPIIASNSPNVALIAPSYFYGATESDLSKPQPYTITVYNISDKNITLTSLENSASISSLVKDDPIPGGTCSLDGSIAPSESCTFLIQPTGNIDNNNANYFDNTATLKYSIGIEASEETEFASRIATETNVRSASSPNMDLTDSSIAGTVEGIYTLENKGPYQWQPSQDPNFYKINTKDNHAPTVLTTTTSSCLAGAPIDVGKSCDIVIQATKDTTTAPQSGTLRVKKGEDENNLVADYTSESYDVIDTTKPTIEWLFKGPGTNDDFIQIASPLSTQNLIDNQTYTYKIKNISSGTLTIDSISTDIPINNNNCSNGTELNRDGECTFTVEPSYGEDTVSQTITLDTQSDISNPLDKTIRVNIGDTFIFDYLNVGDEVTIDGKLYLVVQDGDGTAGIKNTDVYKDWINADNCGIITSHVTNMVKLFNNASTFNQPLDNWDTSNVTDMSFMFDHATNFNRPLDNWDTSKVTNMHDMFNSDTLFNKPLNKWDTSEVTNMQGMFNYATNFNQPLDNWDTSKVTNMSGMFYNASSFDRPLDNWDTSKVTNMSFMFGHATNFNQPLDNWDTSKVTDISFMFNTATSFNQDISQWNISSVTTSNSFSYGSGLINVNLPKFQ